MPDQNPATEGRLLAPESGVTVRMYDMGPGDCFLLAFRGDDGKARYVLIDCGCIGGYKGCSERSRRVAGDIARATGNHLDVVAVTHEHSDHVNGFGFGRAAFDTISVGELWLSWAENKKDRLAKRLKKTHGKAAMALAAAIEQIRPDRAALAAALEGVLGFDAPGGLGFGVSNADQLTYLHDKSAKKLKKSQDYCHPGQIRTVPGVEGVQAYVLGPPRRIAAITKKSEEGTVHGLAAMDEEDAFLAAVLAADKEGVATAEDRESFLRSMPFDESLGIPKDEAGSHPQHGRFFSQHYGFDSAKTASMAWRQIDTDWLGAVLRIALRQNYMVNNTSLVLAFELTDTSPRKVLLFVGDAEVGNWRSWHKLKWPGAGPSGGTVDAASLLERTVLYKVGHHGSRNATQIGLGLDMMDSSDLVAMIPVDGTWAKEVADWKHPARNLVKELKDRASGRVLRADEIPLGDDPPDRPPECEDEDDWADLLEHLDWHRNDSDDPLWIQYTVTG